MKETRDYKLLTRKEKPMALKRVCLYIHVIEKDMYMKMKTCICICSAISWVQKQETINCCFGGGDLEQLLITLYIFFILLTFFIKGTDYLSNETI